MTRHDSPSLAPYLAINPPEPSAQTSAEPSISRRDRWIGYAIFSGLLVALAVGFAVIVHPPLIVEVRGFLPVLATIGLASTAGGFWWLWRRPR